MNKHLNKNNDNKEIVINEKRKIDVVKIIQYVSSIIGVVLTLFGQFWIGLIVIVFGLISASIVKVIKNKKKGGFHSCAIYDRIYLYDM